MAKFKSNLEDLFKNEFEYYSIEPSNDLWNKIQTKLMFKNFLKFSWSGFNVFYLAIVLITVASVTALLTNNNIQSEILAAQDTNKVLNFISHQPNSDDMIDVMEHKTALEQNTENTNEKQEKSLEKVIHSDSKQQKTTDENTKTNFGIQSVLFKAGYLKLGPAASDIKCTMSIKKGCAPLQVSFSSSSTDIRSFIWNFGDNTTSMELSPTHLYKSQGVYLVTLTALKFNGEQMVFIDTITVFPNPVAKIALATSEPLLVNKPVSFVSNSSNAISYEWNFGDNKTANINAPQHIYTKSGNFTVRLKVFSNNQCSDSTVLNNVEVNETSNVLVFPTAFSPSLSGPSNGAYDRTSITNDVFFPSKAINIDQYKLKIFSRNGMLVFESNNILKGWDGYINNKIALPGVYVYQVKGKFLDGEVFDKTGNITLLHNKQ